MNALMRKLICEAEVKKELPDLTEVFFLYFSQLLVSFKVNCLGTL